MRLEGRAIVVDFVKDDVARRRIARDKHIEASAPGLHRDGCGGGLSQVSETFLGLLAGHGSSP